MLQKKRHIVAAAAIAGLFAVSGIALPAKAEVPESKDPIKLVIMGYSGDNIIMYIYGMLIEKLGYDVEFTPADYLGQFAGLKAGDLHIGSAGMGHDGPRRPWPTLGRATRSSTWATWESP